MISEKKGVTFEVLFCEDHHYMFVDCFVENLTRKHEKELQLIWPLKCDTVEILRYAILHVP